MGTNFENILCRSEKERIRSMYNKTTIRFGVRDIQNNQGLGKGYQVTPTSTLIILDNNQKNFIQQLFIISPSSSCSSYS